MSFTRTLIRAPTLTKQTLALKRLPVLSRAFHNSPYRLADPYPLPLSREVEEQRALPHGGVESSESSALNTETEEEWPMPQPLDRTGEKTETMRARLVYQARKRGMLEGDLLLATFARDNLASMDHDELKQFDKVGSCSFVCRENDADVRCSMNPIGISTTGQLKRGTLQRGGLVVNY